MKICKYAFLFLLAGVVSNTVIAQRITNTQPQLNQKTVVAQKDVKTIGTFKYTGVDYRQRNRRSTFR